MIRSIIICVKGGAFSGTVILKRGICSQCVRFLFYWQVAHPLIYWLIHWQALGYKYSHCTFQTVSSCPRCPPL